MTLGQFIGARRMLLGWSQKTLAERLGVSRPLISMVENGRKSLGLRRVERWARELEAPRAELVRLTLQREVDRLGLPFRVQLERV